jgi:hypothetical protein
MDKPTLIENSLIPVYQFEKGTRLVNARELYEFLCIESEPIKDFYNYYDLLILAAKNRFEDEFKCIKQSLDILEISKMIDVHEQDGEYLRDAVWESIIHAKHSFKKNEFDLHKKFKSMVSTLIPGAKIILFKNNKEHIPDFWVDVNGLRSPVEIKYGKFGFSALKQLKRYMKFYDCKSGYAVARELTCTLPNSITFIPLSL